MNCSSLGLDPGTTKSWSPLGGASESITGMSYGCWMVGQWDDPVRTLVIPGGISHITGTTLSRTTDRVRLYVCHSWTSTCIVRTLKRRLLIRSASITLSSMPAKLAQQADSPNLAGPWSVWTAIEACSLHSGAEDIRFSGRIIWSISQLSTVREVKRRSDCNGADHLNWTRTG